MAFPSMVDIRGAKKGGEIGHLAGGPRHPKAPAILLRGSQQPLEKAYGLVDSLRRGGV